MFDVFSTDLYEVPLPYTVLNGTDVFAAKVKRSVAVPWLEVVCGRRCEEEVFLFGNLREYEHFSLEAAAKTVRSIACRVLDKTSGKLLSIDVSKVVLLKDGISIRYSTPEGALLEPFSLNRDLDCSNELQIVLFQVNAKARKAPRQK